jgi:C4-dicarboxylate transporter, DctM subunit
MSPDAAVILALVVLVFCFACRVPAAFSLGLAGFTGLLAMDGFDRAASTLSRVAFGTPGRYLLLVIPMFLAMGVFAKNSRLAEHAFWAASRLFRRVPGGLALATLGTCAAFGAVSGSSVATVVAAGKTALHEMLRHGYRAGWAAGVICAAGTLSVLIPPSVVLVVFGIVTGESIGGLIIGAVLPGVLSVLVIAALLLLRGQRQLTPERVAAMAGGGQVTPRAAPGEPGEPGSAAPSRLVMTRALAQITFLAFVVIGGIYLGWFTATESAAVGALAALLFLVFNTGAERWRSGLTAMVTSVRRNVRSSLSEAATLTAMVFCLLIGATLFTQLLVLAAVPRRLTEWVLYLEIAPALTVALILLACVPLGMFLDSLSIILITAPIAYPIVTALGFDGIWFGILMVIMVEIGLITPPVGLSVYAIAAVSRKVTVEVAFGGAMWFLPAYAVVAVLIFVFPAIVTLLPGRI